MVFVLGFTSAQILGLKKQKQITDTRRVISHENVFSVCRGLLRHEHMLHSGFHSHHLRDCSHHPVLQSEGKVHSHTHTLTSTLKFKDIF